MTTLTYYAPSRSPSHAQQAMSMIYKRAGILVPHHRKDHVDRNLEQLQVKFGFESVPELLESLDTNVDHQAWSDFIEIFTINHTAFFREAHHFEHLKEQLKARGPLRIWCAAASTGEEPYSLAMTMNEAFGELAHLPTILATDIDKQAIATAQRGVYDATKIATLNPEKIRMHFLRGTDSNLGSAKVKDSVKKRVQFDVLNLNGLVWPKMGPFDVIFCRNTMIYFDRPAQTKLLDRFAQCLEPNGLLYIGHSENVVAQTNRFRLLGKTVYQKIK